jgi:hypothetical protein
MTDNVPVIAIPSPSLTKLASENQFCLPGMIIQRPTTVYTMRVNQAFDSLDRVHEIAFDEGSGTYTDAVAGMTVLVSAVGYGKWEKGICRLRRTLTEDVTGTAQINELSHIVFANDDYLTVVRSFSIWQKDLTTDNANIRMDYDLVFGAFADRGPIPRIGPIVSVVSLVNGVASFSPPSAELSACYDGDTIATYHVECAGATSIDDADTPTPTFHFDTAGEYLWWSTITTTLGGVSLSYRWIYVSPTSEKFKLLSCSGDFESGEWMAKVRCFTTDLSGIHDRAMVTLYQQQESFGYVMGSIGKLTGYENIIYVGWINGKTIKVHKFDQYVEFEIRGPAFWLSKLRAFPFGVEDTSSAAAAWTEIQELTVDKALAHLLYWTTTATLVMDCFFTGDTKRVKKLVSPAENLWDQLTELTFNTIFARPRVNSLGQLFVQVDPQLLPTAGQAALTVVQTITKNTYKGFLELKNVEDVTSKVELSGASVWDGTIALPLFSHAPGSIGSPYGSGMPEDNYLFEDQADCNRIAGVLYAVSNAPYEAFDLEISGQNRFFDIAPNQLGRISVAAEDNTAGVELTNVRIIPRAIDLVYDENKKTLTPVITFEFLIQDVANVVDGITYVPPTPADEDYSDNYKMPEYSLPALPNTDLGSWFPGVIPGLIPPAPCTSQFNSYKVSWDRPEIRGDDTNLVAHLYFPCKVRPKSYNLVSPSMIQFNNSSVYDDALTNITVYGIKGGARVISATWDGGVAGFVFDPALPMALDGFEVEMNAGLGPSPTYVPLGQIDSGTVAATDSLGAHISPIDSVVGHWYCVEGAGGPWNGSVPLGYTNNYGFCLNGNGWVGYDSGPHTFRLEKSAIAVYAEAINGLIGRQYFWGLEDIYYACGFDPNYGDNAGTFGYIVRNARVDGRRLVLTGTLVKNVCPAEES